MQENSSNVKFPRTYHSKC